MPQDPSKCPLCKKQRLNPAALNSGFVFCYTCIHSYVSKAQQCPITKRPTSLDAIRKIYTSDKREN